MGTITRREVMASLLAAPAAVRSLADNSAGWISLFDGKTLKGWKASEREWTFKVVHGQIVAHGDRSHLFYVGRGSGADFKNFEFSAEIMTRSFANSGIYFHTAYQASGWPAAGFEVQIKNAEQGGTGYIERKKTGSLYGVRDVYKQFVRDDEWFRLNIVVRGKQVQVRLNNMLVVDYVEPSPPFRADLSFQRVLNHGTFALQGHDAEGVTHFKNIRVRPLPDDAGPLSNEKPDVDDLYRDVIVLGAENYPLVDYHVHLKGGLTIDEALQNSRRLGINYGIAINCGMGFPVHSDESLHAYLDGMKNQPCFVGLQGEGREWMTVAAPDSIARFDYVLTDAMTFTDDNGKRMRIWIDEEIGVISDKQAFMNMYVDRIVKVMREPIDIYANATFLPRQIAAEYDALWTQERMHTVISAAVENEVAIEINNRYKVPSAAFIKAAKAAGAKFSFGTNNPDANLGRLEYPIAMVKQCGLIWQDFFVPLPDGQKKIQLRK